MFLDFENPDGLVVFVKSEMVGLLLPNAVAEEGQICTDICTTCGTVVVRGDPASVVTRLEHK